MGIKLVSDSGHSEDAYFKFRWVGKPLMQPVGFDDVEVSTDWYDGPWNEMEELAEEVEWSRDAAPQFERRQDDGRQWVDARRGEAEADVAEQACVDWNRGQF